MGGVGLNTHAMAKMRCGCPRGQVHGSNLSSIRRYLKENEILI